VVAQSIGKLWSWQFGKIIKRTVDALLLAGKPDFLWDDALKGFEVKILPSGRASYILQCRMGGAEAAFPTSASILKLTSVPYDWDMT